jgi:RNA polymerase sigma-70 factor (ECF subfamily)
MSHYEQSSLDSHEGYNEGITLDHSLDLLDDNKDVLPQELETVNSLDETKQTNSPADIQARRRSGEHTVIPGSEEHLTTNSLVRRIQREGIDSQWGGDAFSKLYQLYYNDMYRLAVSIVKMHATAEDIVQIAFIKAATNIEKYDCRQGVPVKNWLMRVAHNTAIDYLRKRDNKLIPCAEIREDKSSGKTSGAESSRDTPLEGDVRSALEQLPNDQRKVMILRFVLGYTGEEVADQMGRSVDSINGLQHRGRATLKLYFEKNGSAPSVLRPEQAGNSTEIELPEAA